MSNDQPTAALPPPPRPPAGPPPFQRSQTATRAAVCALIPGIGAVYNREYEKAVVHFSVFAGLAYMGEEVGIFGLAAFCFYVFTIIDAYRSAEAISRRGTQPRSQNDQINLPVWGGLLVLMGVIFLLDNLGAISLRTAVRFWPLLLILLGLYLVAGYFKGSGGNTSPSGGRQVPDPGVEEQL